jgi:hypothetical protein
MGCLASAAAQAIRGKTMLHHRVTHHAIAAALALTLASAVPAAAQQTSGLYVLGGLGINWLQDSDVKGGAVNSKVDFDHGLAGIAALGYGLGNGLRLEGELGYRRNDVDSVDSRAGDGG